MFLEQAKQALSAVFMEHGDLSETAQSAINLAYFQLLKSPSLGNTYPHICMHQRGPNFWVPMAINHYSNKEHLNVLENLYHSESDYDWEYMTKEQVKATDKYLASLPKMPSSFSYSSEAPYNDCTPYLGDYPSNVKNLAALYLEKLALSNEFMERILLNEEPLPDLREIRYQLLTSDEMQTYLDTKVYLEAENRKSRLPGVGLAYFSLEKDYLGVIEKFYLIAESPYGMMGVACLYHSKETQSVVLSYLSVAPGYRNMGISRYLCEEAIDYAKNNNAYIKRTSPGRFAQENPGITQGFDKIFQRCQWPVVNNDEYMRENMIQDLLKTHPHISQWSAPFLHQFPRGSIEQLAPLNLKSRQELLAPLTTYLDSKESKNRLDLRIA